MSTVASTKLQGLVPRRRSGRTVAKNNGGLNHGEDSKISQGPYYDAPELQFVTITGQQTTLDRVEASKRVRTQVMRDYLHKQQQQHLTGTVEPVRAVEEDPNRLKGRFKLDSWSHKTKTKAKSMNAQQAHGKLVKPKKQGKTGLNPEDKPLNTQPERNTSSELKRPSTLSLHPLDSGALDPFNSLSITLGPLSQKLLLHCDFFSQARTDPVILHSILHLVALHHDLRLKIIDSPESLYHGSEAFKMINERLEYGIFTDMTIAAVGMLVTKENINGKYDLSTIHMEGLEYMVKSRGGIEMLQGVFQRIVSWTDFCYSNVWNCRPRFPRLFDSIPILNIDHHLYYLPAEDLYGFDSPMISIIYHLRTLSHSLCPSQLPTADRQSASNQIYDLEYTLLSLNPDKPGSHPCRFSFEAIPLKEAAHLYLYLVIREVPPAAKLLSRLVERLQDGLQVQMGGWWWATLERKTWLLWMLFMGAAAAKGWERWWFVKEIGALSTELEIRDEVSLGKKLERVVWQEEWCGEHCKNLWDDLQIFEGNRSS